MKSIIIKSIPFLIVALLLTFFIGRGQQNPGDTIMDIVKVEAISEAEASAPEIETRSIVGEVRSGDTLSVIFETHGLDPQDVNPVVAAARKTYDLARLRVGNPYSFNVSGRGSVEAFTYQYDEEHLLKVLRRDDEFTVENIAIPYERRTAHIGGVIRNNLISSVNNPAVAITLSDVFAWDIDFATGLREGDTFKAVVEALYRDGKLARYGKILAAEFVNGGVKHMAYRFTPQSGNGNGSHYGDDGKSIRRAFLKAPLSYRRISSGYSYGRYHPILKIVRPHLGVDYAARAGTPISAVGDGTVTFAGWKGVNGNLVIIKHAGSYTTSYGHMQKISRGVRRGKKVTQGQVIGWVGSTGRSTGPHLDYRVKQGGRPVNPVKLVMPRETSVPKDEMEAFMSLKESMDMRLASIITGESLVAHAKSP